MKVDCALQDITLTSVACATTDSCGTAFPLAQKQAWKWLSATNGHEVASQHKKCCGQEEIGSNYPGREVNMPPVNPLFFSKKLTTKHHAVCAGVRNAVPIEMKGVITAVLDTIMYSSPLMLDLEYCNIKEADRQAAPGVPDADGLVHRARGKHSPLHRTPLNILHRVLVSLPHTPDPFSEDKSEQ